MRPNLPRSLEEIKDMIKTNVRWAENDIQRGHIRTAEDHLLSAVMMYNTLTREERENMNGFREMVENLSRRLKGRHNPELTVSKVKKAIYNALKGEVTKEQFDRVWSEIEDYVIKIMEKKGHLKPTDTKMDPLLIQALTDPKMGLIESREVMKDKFETTEMVRMYKETTSSKYRNPIKNLHQAIEGVDYFLVDPRYVAATYPIGEIPPILHNYKPAAISAGEFIGINNYGNLLFRNIKTGFTVMTSPEYINYLKILRRPIYIQMYKEGLRAGSSPTFFTDGERIVTIAPIIEDQPEEDSIKPQIKRFDLLQSYFKKWLKMPSLPNAFTSKEIDLFQPIDKPMPEPEEPVIVIRSLETGKETELKPVSSKRTITKDIEEEVEKRTDEQIQEDTPPDVSPIVEETGKTADDEELAALIAKKLKELG